MADDAELQARIAAIAGRINRHNQQQHTPSTGHPSRHARWHPYQSNRITQFKNRTLVVDRTTDAQPHAEADNDGEHQPFVKARGTNNQLMTQSTYEREQNSRSQYKKQARPVSIRHQQNYQERQSLAKHFQRNNTGRLVQINGIQFEMKSDGSKLTRVSEQSSDKKTPRKATIAGVEFLRTKNGNLLRKGALKDSIRYPCVDLPREYSSQHRSRKREQQRLLPQCEHFTKNGSKETHPGLNPMPHCKYPRSLTIFVGKCPYGPRCRFAHDPAQVAMCKTFLRTGQCLMGNYCDLSHDPTYHRVSACTHFQNLQCNNADCRYPHIRVNPGAPVCRAFATLGYCDAGPACKNRHVHECPDYANNGSCPMGNCPLPHILRASTQRAVASDADSEIDEKDAADDHDLDSDDLSEDLVTAGRDDSGMSLADNDDFVPF